MVKVSRTFMAALKLHSIPAYRLGQMVGLSSSTLSRLIHGVDPIKEGDARIVALGKLLQVPEQDCFERADSN